MFRITAIAVCVLITLSSTGQNRIYNIELHDGSRVSGTIVRDSSGYLDINVITPLTIRIGKSQVSSIEELRYPVKKNQKTEGYYIRLSTGILSGKNESGGLSSLSLHFSNGYQLRNGLGFGIGSGIEYMGVAMVPLYADLRYTPFNSRVSPYAWLKSGYGFATSDQALVYEFNPATGSKTKGGFLFSTGAGISLFTWQRTAMNMGIGYRYQKITISQDQYWWVGTAIRETVTHFNRLEVQLAFVFR